MNVDSRLNRQLFQALIGQRKLTAKDFFDKWTSKYKVKMTYNNFMELVNNNIGWKLTYAFSVAEMLEVDITELFEYSHEI